MTLRALLVGYLAFRPRRDGQTTVVAALFVLKRQRNQSSVGAASDSTPSTQAGSFKSCTPLLSVFSS